MRAHSQRLSSVVLSTVALFFGACQEDVGSLGNAHTGGERDASVPGGMGCTLSHGFWKNHEDDWPVTSLMLGGRSYDQAALLALLRSPSHGDASLILAKQLIAAKLNVAAGASSIGAITEGDAWIDAHDDSQALPLGIHASTAAGNEAVQIAADLTAYNQGQTGPGHCPGDQPPQCGPGLTNCGGVCVDTGSDESHCGVCDSVCLPGKMCIAGACVLPGSDAGAGMDAGMDAGPPPVDAGMDAGPPPMDAGMDAGPPPMDAGMDAGPPDAGQDAGPPPGCGDGGACGPHAFCNASSVCACEFNALDCDGLQSNGCETSRSRDDCAACGDVCPESSPVCHALSLSWACGAPCSEGRADCDGIGGLGDSACEAVLAMDEANCGACGNACAAGQVCWEASCLNACPTPMVICDATCKDLRTDNSACGSCGNACAFGQRCELGVCEGCPFPTLDCDGVPGCEATLGTHAHCASCNDACSATSYCELEINPNPFCTPCASGTRDCDGLYPNFCEVNVTTDESNCGTCGHACAVGQTCVNGNCV